MKDGKTNTVLYYVDKSEPQVVSPHCSCGKFVWSGKYMIFLIFHASDLKVIEFDIYPNTYSILEM